MMPTSQDVEEMHEAGYGLSTRILAHSYGGLKRLQHSLGFYPDGYSPSPEELTQRFKWIVEHAFLVENKPETIDSLTMDDLINWGAERDLTPGRTRVYSIYDGNTLPLRRALGIERKNTAGAISKLDLYKLGARIIKKNGGPISGIELSRQCAGEFVGDAYGVIRWNFGSLSNFWKEFGYIPDASGLSREQVKELGVRWNIQYGQTHFTPGLISDLSHAKRFVSKEPITRHFGSIPSFRKEVEADYGVYTALKAEFEKKGVDPYIFRLACGEFVATDEFASRLRNHTDTLAVLSGPNADYVLTIIERGFDLLDEEVFKFQMEDFSKCLGKLGIREATEIQFVLDLVPRYCPQ